ncbi:Hypothetical protein CGLY_07280 [Corynebacterium glyciniphilum AJ 3170]|uniref:Uncharacterized protein n=1 Tax=Corynebacterium glyciniphilum AJ 3170 TaxID=1404245 RepID=X5EBA0_9CORY|nr:hypothetical protein [Corynebacterium glyciniphilum]AHW63901.1 Hypothetical protein CGLY_07280 [Corynebacterium glyciniphilum AJ 3170]
MPVTEPVNSPSVEELTVYPFNRMELRMAQSGLRGRSAAERAAISEMVRTRGAAYAARFRHAAELSWRMPEMYWSAVEDGRMTLEHMDAIWRRIDRHAGLRSRIEDQEADLQRQRDLVGGEREGEDGSSSDAGCCSGADFYGEPVPWEVNDAPWRRRFPDVESPYCPSADRSVERAVTDWLLACPHRLITSSGAGSLIPRSTVTIHRLRDVVDAAVDEDLTNREAYEQEGSLSHPDPFEHPF